MEFINAYKRLDNLCKDIFTAEKGVTTYIEEMEKISSGKFEVKNWDNAYKKLKHYRYIRNKIVHDNDATEDNMCDYLDIEWLEQFYSKILNRSDPLAVYEAILREQNSKPKQKPSITAIEDQNKYSFNGLILLISLAVIAIASIMFLYLR